MKFKILSVDEEVRLLQELDDETKIQKSANV